MGMSHSVVVLVSGAFSRLRLGLGDPLEVLVVPGLQWNMWFSSTGCEYAPAGVPLFRDSYLEPGCISQGQNKLL